MIEAIILMKIHGFCETTRLIPCGLALMRENIVNSDVQFDMVTVKIADL